MAIIDSAFIELLSHGRGFRAGFREWRFNIPMNHYGSGDSAHAALLRAVAHMAKINTSREETAKLLRAVANEVEQG